MAPNDAQIRLVRNDQRNVFALQPVAFDHVRGGVRPFGTAYLKLVEQKCT